MQAILEQDLAIAKIYKRLVNVDCMQPVQIASGVPYQNYDFSASRKQVSVEIKGKGIKS